VLTATDGWPAGAAAALRVSVFSILLKYVISPIPLQVFYRGNRKFLTLSQNYSLLPSLAGYVFFSAKGNLLVFQ